MRAKKRFGGMTLKELKKTASAFVKEADDTPCTSLIYAVQKLRPNITCDKAIEVLPFDKLKGQIRSLLVVDKSAERGPHHIFVPPDIPRVLRRFLIMHELSHFLLDEKYEYGIKEFHKEDQAEHDRACALALILLFCRGSVHTRKSISLPDAFRIAVHIEHGDFNMEDVSNIYTDLVESGMIPPDNQKRGDP